MSLPPPSARSVNPQAAQRPVERTTPTGLHVDVSALGGGFLLMTRTVGLRLDVAGFARLHSDFAALAAAQAGGAGPADGAGPAGDGFVVQTGLGAMPLLPADLPVLVEALAEAVRSGLLAPPDTIRPPRGAPVS